MSFLNLYPHLTCLPNHLLNLLALFPVGGVALLRVFEFGAEDGETAVPVYIEKGLDCLQGDACFAVADDPAEAAKRLAVVVFVILGTFS